MSNRTNQDLVRTHEKPNKEESIVQGFSEQKGVLRKAIMRETFIFLNKTIYVCRCVYVCAYEREKEREKSLLIFFIDLFYFLFWKIRRNTLRIGISHKPFIFS